jgi:hypothetical protein
VLAARLGDLAQRIAPISSTQSPASTSAACTMRAPIGDAPACDLVADHASTWINHGCHDGQTTHADASWSRVTYFG